MPSTARAEIEMDGHIYFVEYDENNKVISKDELDKGIVLKLLVAVLDNAVNNPFLDKMLAKKT